MKKNLINKIVHSAIYLLAFIGLVFVSVFFAMQYGLLNVRGSSIDRNASLGVLPKTTNSTNCLSETGSTTAVCDWNKTAEWSVVNEGVSKDLTM
jgi:hypothetical protein